MLSLILLLLVIGIGCWDMSLTPLWCGCALHNRIVASEATMDHHVNVGAAVGEGDEARRFRFSESGGSPNTRDPFTKLHSLFPRLRKRKHSLSPSLSLSLSFPVKACIRRSLFRHIPFRQCSCPYSSQMMKLIMLSGSPLTVMSRLQNLVGMWNIADDLLLLTYCPCGALM